MATNLKEALAKKQALTEEVPTTTTEETKNMDLETTLEKKTDGVEETVYEGQFRILNKHATPIEKDGDVYKPKNEAEIECLEYQVKMNRITKRTL